MKFKYTMLRLNFKDPQVIKADLDELGDEGWDLVAIWPDTATEGIAILKKLITED
jgi:hypothetical protein